MEDMFKEYYEACLSCAKKVLSGSDEGRAMLDELREYDCGLYNEILEKAKRQLRTVRLT